MATPGGKHGARTTKGGGGGRRSVLLGGSGRWLLLSTGGNKGGIETGGCLDTQRDLQKHIIVDVVEGGERPSPLQVRLQVVILLDQDRRTFRTIVRSGTSSSRLRRASVMPFIL
jgi:hypothetical protein